MYCSTVSKGCSLVDCLLQQRQQPFGSSIQKTHELKIVHSKLILTACLFVIYWNWEPIFFSYLFWMRICKEYSYYSLYFILIHGDNEPYFCSNQFILRTLWHYLKIFCHIKSSWACTKHFLFSLNHTILYSYFFLENCSLF